MFENGVFRRRNLPHVDVEGKPTFITACLHGSIPTSGLREIYTSVPRIPRSQAVSGRPVGSRVGNAETQAGIQVCRFSTRRQICREPPR